MKRRVTKCPAEITLTIIGGRWKVLLLYHLFQGVKRFSELQRAVSSITQKMLTQQLREMERDGLVHREVYPEVPPRVEYSMTALGMTLEPVVGAMCEWGIKYKGGEVDQAESEPLVVNLAARQSDEIAQHK